MSSRFKILKYKSAVILAKLTIRLLRLFGHGGTTLPGKIALNIDPGIVNHLTDPYRIIMITGTNGKTTTSRVIGQILKENRIPFITNKSGANLISGILTTFLENETLNPIRENKGSSRNLPAGDIQKTTALLEIDEAAFRKISNYFSPDILIVTNFFRDQLDRYGELYTTVKGVKEGIGHSDRIKLILNADDSLCASLGKDISNQVVYFGLDIDETGEVRDTINHDASFCLYCKEKYIYSKRIYGHLGHYECPSCGYKRPVPVITCSKILNLTSSGSEVEFSTLANRFASRINLPGMFNIYNSLAGVALAESLGFPQKNTINALGSFECGFGRMESIDVDGKKIRVILVKNPTGFNQVLRFLKTESQSTQIAILINDNLADGTDISWLWDVDFEVLQEIQGRTRTFFTSGIRGEDMAVRLKYAGITTDKIRIIHDYKRLLEEGLNLTKKEETFYILPTYTAMLDIRKVMQKRFKLKEFWE